jgi:hypothetical protein
VSLLLFAQPAGGAQASPLLPLAAMLIDAAGIGGVGRSKSLIKLGMAELASPFPLPAIPSPDEARLCTRRCSKRG